MGEYIFRRFLQAIPAVLGVTLFVFLLLHASGNPAQFLLGPEATEEDRATYIKAYGLDKPLYVQYIMFLFHMLKGDFGKSITYGVSAMEVVRQRLPATLKLTLLSIFLSLIVNIPAGVISAVKRGTIFDYLAMLGATAGQALPQFWLGLILILLFAVKLHLLPTSGMGSGVLSPKHAILPALTLSPWLMALSFRLIRSSMLEVLCQDYIRTAYAKGLAPWVVLTRHALRNALIPVINVTGLTLAYLMGGAVIVETIFAWPGIGLLSYRSVINRDYNMVLCIVTITATFFILTNLLTDIIVGYIDPRVRMTVKRKDI